MPRRVLLLFCASLICTFAVLRPARAESAEPTMADLQERLTEMSARLAELQGDRAQRFICRQPPSL